MKKPILVEKINAGLARAVFAECFGTALFVYLGTGTILATGLDLNQDGPSSIINGTLSRLLPIATGFGFAYGVLVYIFFHISGGHMNPAVTLTMFLLGECSFIRLTLYWVSQLLGALLGSLVLWGCTNDLKDGLVNDDRAGVPPLALGAVELNDALNEGNGFFFEFIGTMILCWIFAIFTLHRGSLTFGTPNLGPLVIGLTVVVLHLVLVPFTGCGINPARMFGPALANSFAGDNTWNESAWIYWIGPLVGSLVATVVYIALHDTVKLEMPEEKMKQPSESGKAGAEPTSNQSPEKPQDSSMAKSA